MGTDTEPGMTILAVHDVFRAIESARDSEFLVRVSYVELYQEEIRDLLNPDTPAAGLKNVDHTEVGGLDDVIRHRDLGEFARQITLRDLLLRRPNRLTTAGHGRDQGQGGDPAVPAVYSLRAIHATLPPGNPRGTPDRDPHHVGRELPDDFRSRRKLGIVEEGSNPSARLDAFVPNHLAVFDSDEPVTLAPAFSPA